MQTWAPDTLSHFLEYFFFASTLVWGMSRGLRVRLSPHKFALLGAVSIFYAVVDEFHQSFVPGRHASWADVAADALGAAFGLAACSLLQRRNPG